jgi:ABC-type Zn uptake system ZnuABC Zn-binding protein ZnuA
MRLSQTNAQALLDKWQPILRLADWDIEITPKQRRRILHKSDATNGVYGALKESSIDIVETKPSSADHETVVVHELLHCHTDPFFNDDTEKEVEIMVEQVAKAFVQLDRKWSRKYEKLLGEFRALEARYARDCKEEKGDEVKATGG